MSKPSTPQAIKDQIRELWKAGCTATQIAAKLGAPFYGVRHHIRRMGLKRSSQPVGGRPRTVWTPEMVEQITRLRVEQEMSVLEIEAVMGLSHDVVGKKLHALALPVPAKHATFRGDEWTSDEIEQLKAMWAEGVPASKIGLKLGRTSSGILGKAHRLNLPSRPACVTRTYTTKERDAGQAKADARQRARVAIAEAAERAVVAPALKDGNRPAVRDAGVMPIAKPYPELCEIARLYGQRDVATKGFDLPLLNAKRIEDGLRPFAIQRSMPARHTAFAIRAGHVA